MLDSQFQQYTLARTLNRRHHFYVGPTNSGKTFQALNSLIAAPSGIYLAPLRLLAMEVRDKLMQAGIACNLITGEERELVEGAKHCASTIEMMNPSIPVNVAVIDEIQMLQDRDRGSAWTAALVGVPARQVFVCGSNAVTNLCMSVLDALNETFEISYCERMTPLVLESESFCGTKSSIPNLFLAIFNILPLHPLDGGKVLARFLPPSINYKLEQNEQLTSMLLLVLIIAVFY